MDAPSDSPTDSSTPEQPRLLAGASGFSYKKWCGSFYPERIAADAMLAHYAERLPTVEINNSFEPTAPGYAQALMAAAAAAAATG